MEWQAIGEMWLMVGALYGLWIPSYFLRHKNKVFMYIHKEVYLNGMWRNGILRILRIIPGVAKVAGIAAMMVTYEKSPVENEEHYSNFMRKG